MTSIDFIRLYIACGLGMLGALTVPGARPFWDTVIKCSRRPELGVAVAAGLIVAFWWLIAGLVVFGSIAALILGTFPGQRKRRR